MIVDAIESLRECMESLKTAKQSAEHAYRCADIGFDARQRLALLVADIGDAIDNADSIRNTLKNDD